MNITRPLPALLRLLALALVLLGTTGLAWPNEAEDPPGRAGRLADLRGGVSWYDQEQGQWANAERNQPLTAGDRISTAPQGRAELRVGSTVLRLGGGSELEVLRLDDQRMQFQLHAGSLALRVRTRELADEIELITAEARLQPERAGHYRLDRLDDTSYAATWRGTLRVADEPGLRIDTGQRLELWRQGGRELRHSFVSLDDDTFAQWALAEDQRDERTASSRYVSPEMTGAEDLDRHGRWEQHPEYGPLWLPFEVRVDWAPYRHGRWTWVRPWGWTWVDEAPWGFAPFHYGRWVHWHGRWGWVPGAYVPRPVFVPALVAWVGGGNWSVGIGVGGPAVGWVPLAPGDLFRPWYRSTPVYVDRINTRPQRPGQRPPPHPPGGPDHYGNQAVPGAVTVVPRDVLARRQPVDRTLHGEPADRGQRGPGHGTLRPVEPPAREWRGAEPPRRDLQPPPRPPEHQRPPPRPTPVPAPEPRRDGQPPRVVEPAPAVVVPPPQAQPAPPARGPRHEPRFEPPGQPASQPRIEPPAPRFAPPAARIEPPANRFTPPARHQPPPPAAAPAPQAPPPPEVVRSPGQPPQRQRPPQPESKPPRADDDPKPQRAEDERKSRPEARPGMRERENLR